MLTSILCLLALSATSDSTFAEPAVGREFIVADTAYFDQLEPLEMAAKAGLPLPAGTLAAQRTACRERYRAGVREFTTEEQRAILAATKSIDSALANDYPLYVSTPWRFIKMASNIEGGMPHTRGPFIVLSSDVCSSIADDFARSGAKTRSSNWVVGLLLHEKMHVVQRLHPEVFDDLYIAHWGLIKSKRIIGCPWLEEHHLANPDGPDCPWVYPLKQDGKTTYLWPLVTLSDGSSPKRMPEDFRLLAVHVTLMGDGCFKVETSRNGKPISDDLESVAAYCEAFPGGNNYHPNETLADHFSEMVLTDHFTRASAVRGDGKHLTLLRAWCRDHLRPISKRI